MPDTVDNTPNVNDAVYPNFVGVNIYTFGASHYPTQDPGRIDGEFLTKPVQDELLKHQALLRSLATFDVRNETGGTLVKGTLVYPSSWSVAQSRFMIAGSDYNYPQKRACWVLTEDLANNTNGIAYGSATITGTAGHPIDTSAFGAVGDKVYLYGAPGLFATEVADYNVSAQDVGVVIVKDAVVGSIAFYPILSFFKEIGTGWLKDSSITDAKVHPFTITAKVGNYVLLAAENHATFTNAGAAGAVQFTLPAAAAGLHYRIARTANQTVTVIPAAGTIKFGDESGTTLTLTSLTGEAFIWSDGANWFVSSISGNHTLA